MALVWNTVNNYWIDWHGIVTDIRVPQGMDPIAFGDFAQTSPVAISHQVRI